MHESQYEVFCNTSGCPCFLACFLRFVLLTARHATFFPNEHQNQSSSWCPLSAKLVIARLHISHGVKAICLQVYNFQDGTCESKLESNNSQIKNRPSVPVTALSSCSICWLKCGKPSDGSAAHKMWAAARSCYMIMRCTISSRYHHLCPVHPAIPSSTSFHRLLWHWCQP